MTGDLTGRRRRQAQPLAKDHFQLADEVEFHSLIGADEVPQFPDAVLMHTVGQQRLVAFP
ncbi:hypothetical protein D3C84_1248160 [compost metagenome]